MCSCVCLILHYSIVVVVFYDSIALCEALITYMDLSHVPF